MKKISLTVDEISISKENKWVFEGDNYLKLFNIGISEICKFEEWIFENDNFIEMFIFRYMLYNGYSEMNIKINENTEEIDINKYSEIRKIKSAIA